MANCSSKQHDKVRGIQHDAAGDRCDAILISMYKNRSRNKMETVMGYICYKHYIKNKTIVQSHRILQAAEILKTGLFSLAWHYEATGRVRAMNLVILNHGYLTRMKSVLSSHSPSYHTSSTGETVAYWGAEAHGDIRKGAVASTAIFKLKKSFKLKSHPRDETETILEAKREEFVEDALIYAKSLCEKLELSLELPRRIRRKHIFDDGSKDVQLSYEDDLRRKMFSSLDRVTADIRERFLHLQNLAQKYVFLSLEVILSMNEPNFDQALIKTLIKKNSNLRAYVYKLS
ncbi:uncharacterized protein TNCV_4550731 [Trichonephila clavipes]|nr:uncharacterized protein TNCV_4550731 [Trichonephila clavipes]